MKRKIGHAQIFRPKEMWVPNFFVSVNWDGSDRIRG